MDTGSQKGGSDHGTAKRQGRASGGGRREECGYVQEHLEGKLEDLEMAGLGEIRQQGIPRHQVCVPGGPFTEAGGASRGMNLSWTCCLRHLWGHRGYARVRSSRSLVLAGQFSLRGNCSDHAEAGRCQNPWPSMGGSSAQL